MAQPNYLNMEVLYLKSVDENIEKMTDNNYIISGILDDVIETNIQYGFTVITLLNCYIESVLNSILRIGLGDESISGNIPTKIDKIEKHYKLASAYSNSTIDIMRKIRNHLVHFKTPFVGEGTGIVDFEIENMLIGKYFAKSNMQSLRKDCYTFVKTLSHQCGLEVWEYASTISSTGLEIPTTYIYNPKMGYADIVEFENMIKNK